MNTLFFGLLIAGCLGASGCKRERAGQLTMAQIHQVTGELAKAASAAAPDGSVVKTRRARSGTSRTADELYVGLRAQAEAVSVEQKLNGVATEHRLTVNATAEGSNVTRITLQRAGVATHQIEIEVLAARAAAAASQARLAIILDDLGSDRGAADTIFSLRLPLTLSVLPYHAYSEEIARQARAHGCEVLLHLPMQSVDKETPEQQELHPGLSRDEVDRMVTKMLEAVPEADGVNNHQGSEATSNSRLMEELMPVLREAGVFYVDSRTTAATVAYETAKRDGVKTGFRNVPFLDDVQNKAAVMRQLQTAIRGAKEKGEAIAIGHPHAATLEALREIGPEARKQGVELVLASELVH